MPPKFQVHIQSQTIVRVGKPQKSNIAARRPFWKWHCSKPIGYCLWPPSTFMWNLKLQFQSKLNIRFGNHASCRVQKPKNKYGHQAAILNMTSLKINRLLPKYISIARLMFGVDIQSQTKVRVWKPKNLIWPPGGHFVSGVAESQWVSAYGHHKHAYEIWNWNSKANLTYAAETMSSTNRGTDGQMDGQGESSIHPHPPTLLGGSMINSVMGHVKTSVSGAVCIIMEHVFLLSHWCQQLMFWEI